MDRIQIQTGFFGNECLKQICEVERCCSLPDHPEDDVWLYGFSRGRGRSSLIVKKCSIIVTITKQRFLTIIKYFKLINYPKIFKYLKVIKLLFLNYYIYLLIL
jgi:hypothetical protein